MNMTMPKYRMFVPICRHWFLIKPSRNAVTKSGSKMFSTLRRSCPKLIKSHILNDGSFVRHLSSFNLVKNIVLPWATKQPDKPAVILSNGVHNEEITYGSLLDKSNRLASAMCASYDAAGRYTTEWSVIAFPRCALVVLPKTLSWWVINLAGSICEMTISPGTLMLTEKDLTYRLRMCKADAVFCNYDTMQKVNESQSSLRLKVLVGDSEEAETKNLKDGWSSYHRLLRIGEQLEPIKREYDGDSIAQLYFTSGTTGTPKMVPHTQEGLGIGHIVTSKNWLGLRPDDVVWNLSDLGWAKASYTSLYAPLIAGCTIFDNKISKFSAKVILDTLEREPVSVVCFPPTAYRYLVQEDLSSFKPLSLRVCVSAGEPLNSEIFRLWHKYTGIWIREGYGQTEATVTCFTSNQMEVKPGKIGKKSPEYDVKILDENLNEVGPNKIGQIAYDLRNGWPIGLFKGYLDNAELNAKAFQNDYFLTGDKAYVDEEGYFCYVGRSDDLIITAGYRVGPFEVESALIEHPAVMESGVVGVPDDERGLVVKAFIVLNENGKKELDSLGYSNFVKDIQNFVKKQTAPYKYPRKIEFVESLPKTISGKIRRVELRDRS